MTTNAGKTFTVELTRVADRDDLVAEVWIGQELLAENRQEGGQVRLQRAGGTPIQGSKTFELPAGPGRVVNPDGTFRSRRRRGWSPAAAA